jgi:hypothetical protein
MFNKFKEGLVFGAGFTIVFLTLSYSADYFIAPSLLEHKLRRIVSPLPQSMLNTSFQPSNMEMNTKYFNEKPFNELSPEEKIKQASVIAIAKYKKSSDGKIITVIAEFVKKDTNTTIYYKVGDEYPSHRDYTDKTVAYGDGIIIFFTDSPATMKMSMSYSGERISSLGDMPMKMFLEKCKEASL